MLTRPPPPQRSGEARSHLDRADLEALLEIAEAATHHLDLEQLLQVVVAKVAEVVPVERCSAILVDPKEDPDEALVIASHDVPGLRRLPIDLSRYPEVRTAIATRETVVIEDALTDPLLQDVRHYLEETPISSLVVAPLVALGDAYGVLFLRLASSRSLGPHEQSFLKAAASTVANSVRNARLHTSVRRKRDELEAAYLERYRELREANRQLREANRIKDRLLAVCSHDVRAPLNVLLGHARLLLGSPMDDRQRRSLEVIERQAERILQLVEGILDGARGQGEGWQLTLERTELGAFCGQVAADLSTLGAPKGVEVRSLGASPIWAEIDESALRQVLENLVSNAISHSPEGSVVEVETEEDPMAPGFARIEVRDRGKGIDPDELPLIFERYRSSGGKGVGLGLAICRELVELHGGDILVEPRQGGGTTVKITLPSHARQDPEDSSKRRVVVLESRAEKRTLIRERLRCAHALYFAASEEEGIVRSQRILPDAVIVAGDLVDDPTRWVRKLRRQPGLAEVPVLVLVDEAKGAEGPTGRAEGEGALPHLDLEGLRDALRTYLGEEPL